MNTLRALIFDVDGTLADTERDGHRPAFNQAFAEAGLDWHWDADLYGELLAVTGGKERMRHYVAHYRPDFKTADLDALIGALHRLKTAHYTSLLARGDIPLRPGVLRLLQQARAAGLRLAIATTTTPDNVYALLEHARSGLPGWFDVIAAGDIVPRKKPAPDIYLHALERLGLPAENCIAFEDSGIGLRAATAAGLKTVVTPTAYTRAQNFAQASAVLDHLGEEESPVALLRGPTWLDGGVVDLAQLRRLLEGQMADRFNSSI